MVRWLWIAVVFGGCVTSESIPCGDGVLCPQDTECRHLTDPDQFLCATKTQVERCAGKERFADCALDGVPVARCYDGVCLPGGCGNQRMDPGEICEDGNTSAGDGCSSDCLSLETCGGGRVDPVHGETCDDGNHRQGDGCSQTCQQEPPVWTRHAPAPAGMALGGMTYDPSRGRVVLISTQSTDQTWEWDGAQWTASALIPYIYSFGRKAAFDGKRVIMVDGSATNQMQTWSWDGAGWQLLDNQGSWAQAYGLVYDAHRHKIVMVGLDDQGAGMPRIGAWEWNGAAWTGPIASATKPTLYGRPDYFGSIVAFDPVHEKVITTIAAGGPVETWSWDGVDWTNVTPSPAVATPFAGFAGFDPTSQTIIAFATESTSPTAAADSTYAWTGSTWTKSTVAGPGNRVYAQACGAPDGVLLFGGKADTTNTPLLTDVWKFADGAWTQLTAPSPRRDFAIAYDEGRDRLVLFGGNDTGIAADDTWELTESGWRSLTSGAVPPARTFAALGYDPIGRDIVMFGGTDGGGASLTDTWVLVDAAWSQVTPSSAPSTPGRLAFDGHQLTLVTAGSGSLETWHWTGSGWINAPGVGAPPARSSFGVGYDPLRQRLVVFGGKLADGKKTDETWTYDGTTWTQMHPTTSPSPRTPTSLAWQWARGRMLVVGTDLDAWEWDGEEWSAVLADDPPSARTGAMLVGSPHGTFLVDGIDAVSSQPADELWELRWPTVGTPERCEGADSDGDGLTGCADPDCWTVCAPLCPPGATCPSGLPSCGNGVCDSLFESCRTCPVDCSCSPVCGDETCDPGEIGCPGECP